MTGPRGSVLVNLRNNHDDGYNFRSGAKFYSDATTNTQQKSWILCFVTHPQAFYYIWSFYDILNSKSENHNANRCLETLN